MENGGPSTPPGYEEGTGSPRSVSPRRQMSPEPPRRHPSPERAWARVSQDQRRHQQQVQYRHEVARQLHIMRGEFSVVKDYKQLQVLIWYEIIVFFIKSVYYEGYRPTLFFIYIFSETQKK